MPIWGFIFVLAAAVVFAVEGIRLRWGLLAIGLCLLAVGIILTFATSAAPVHF